MHFEKLAYEAALRGLDKQESLLEELRARTGVLLAATSLAASFLGQQAFRNPNSSALAVIALAAFVTSVGAGVFILIPNGSLHFSEAGSGLYQNLFAIRSDMTEVYHRLGYELDRAWKSNNVMIVRLIRALQDRRGRTRGGDHLVGSAIGRYHRLAMIEGPKTQTHGDETPPPPPPRIPGLMRPEVEYPQRGGMRSFVARLTKRLSRHPS